MNPFRERYKSKSNSELIRIIKNPIEYQELALEAAKEELIVRGVSENEIVESEITAIPEVKDNFILSPILNKVKSYFKGNSTEDNIILIISILLGIGSAAGLLMSWTFIRRGIDLESSIFLLINLVQPIIAFLFWERKKIGWIIITITLTYLLVLSIYNFYNPYYLHSDEEVLVYFRNSIFYGVLLYLICKSKVREIYKINAKVMTHVIGWTIGVEIILYIYLVS